MSTLDSMMHQIRVDLDGALLASAVWRAPAAPLASFSSPPGAVGRFHRFTDGGGGAAVTRVCTWILFALVLGACRPDAASTAPEPAPPTDPLAGRPVVANPTAKPGDVTTCPYSGRKFVVEADSPRLDHRGRSYVFCSEQARDAVAASPEKYLDAPAP